MTTKRWFDDLGEVLAFVQALDNADELDTIQSALSIVERPWRWDSDYNSWLRAGRPLAFDRTSARTEESLP